MQLKTNNNLKNKIMFVSELNLNELSCEELNLIEGGTIPPTWWNPITAAVVVGTVIIGASYNAGEAVGEAIYYATH